MNKEVLGKDKGNYKGYEYELNGYGGYEIKGLVSFQPYAGNKLFDNSCEEIRKRLLRRIKYQINKKA